MRNPFSILRGLGGSHSSSTKVQHEEGRGTCCCCCAAHCALAGSALHAEAREGLNRDRRRVARTFSTAVDAGSS